MIPRGFEAFQRRWGCIEARIHLSDSTGESVFGPHPCTSLFTCSLSLVYAFVSCVVVYFDSMRGCLISVYISMLYHCAKETREGILIRGSNEVTRGGCGNA
jgi:hypothetical protein